MLRERKRWQVIRSARFSVAGVVWTVCIALEG